MAKRGAVYRCQNCGYESLQWFGKCPDCAQWNTFVEEAVDEKESSVGKRLTTFSSEPKLLTEVNGKEFNRYRTNISEFDRIVGGGIVPGSLILIGGAPGVGKSTLMLQVLSSLDKFKSLYVSGEESIEQVKLRADRLSLKVNSNCYILSETNLEYILETIDKISPMFVVIDSIQTMYNPNMSSAPGSVSQVREVCAELLNVAKTKNITIFILGHITKEGVIAGPKVLEHLVDTVLYFETEKTNVYRILRVYKNRFGPTNEIGVFEMSSAGLREIREPSKLFLHERSEESVVGTSIVPVIEGSRVLFIEIQALVTPTLFPIPRRMASGIDYNRMALLLAVMEKKIGYNFVNKDVFINVIGGLKVREPAIDLGVICACISNILELPYPYKMVAFGEVGLLGEVRPVVQSADRVSESERLGFKYCILSKYVICEEYKKFKNIKIYPISTIEEIINVLKSINRDENLD